MALPAVLKVVCQGVVAAILIVPVLGEEDTVVGLLQWAPMALLAVHVCRGDWEEVLPGLLVCIILGLHRKESNETGGSLTRTRRGCRRVAHNWKADTEQGSSMTTKWLVDNHRGQTEGEGKSSPSQAMYLTWDLTAFERKERIPRQGSEDWRTTAGVRQGSGLIYAGKGRPGTQVSDQAGKRSPGL